MILRFSILEHIQKKMMQILKELPKREFQNILNNGSYVEIIIWHFGSTAELNVSRAHDLSTWTFDGFPDGDQSFCSFAYMSASF